MSKWLSPSDYFGPFFGSGETVAPGAMAMTASGSGSMTAAGEAVKREDAALGGASSGGMTPWSREQWEAARREQMPAAAHQADELQPTPAELKPRKPIRDPFAAVLPQLTQLEVAAAPLQVPQLVVPADLGVSDEELAAVAVLLTARVNAYRWACTGTNQPLKAA